MCRPRSREGGAGQKTSFADTQWWNIHYEIHLHFRSTWVHALRDLNGDQQSDPFKFHFRSRPLSIALISICLYMHMEYYGL